MSKFDGIFEAAKGKEKPKKRPRAAKASAPPARRRGRPAGKRSDPDYEAITAYIRRDTHRDVKIALLQAGDGQEFSELVEQLLSKWLKAR